MNGSAPRSRRARMRAEVTGSDGEANGSLSMTTHRREAPGTSTPSQNVPVPISTVSSPSRNARRRCPRGASPWTYRVCGSVPRNASVSAESVR